jgi:hypothetical protein
MMTHHNPSSDASYPHGTKHRGCCVDAGPYMTVNTGLYRYDKEESDNDTRRRKVEGSVGDITLMTVVVVAMLFVGVWSPTAIVADAVAGTK